MARFVIILVCYCATSFGQGVSGSFTGRVSDSAAASVANATVTILNAGTGVARTAHTDGNGNYTETTLPPGSYKVIAEKEGFKTSQSAIINLRVDQAARVDITLAIGQVSETVQVNASSVALDTETSGIGQVIGEKQVSDLPLDGRNFLGLLFLAPGAVQISGEQNQFRYNEGGAISIGGARSSSNAYLIDGMTNNDTQYQTPAVVFSVEAIQEFKEQTKTYSAEYGYSVNQVNLSTKSGTNKFHGSVYDFLRNNALDARDFFNVKPQAVNPLRQNQFGYSLGGPVWIPKVYNGQNRTFFFANYEGLRLSTSNTSLAFVPTASELAGKFPATRLVNGVLVTVPIYDPETHLPFSQDSGGNYVVPQARFSRLGQIAAAKFFNTPNLTGNPVYNYSGAIASPVHTDQQNYRIDQHFGKNDSIYFRATIDNVSRTNGGLVPVQNTYLIQDARSYVVGWTHIFTPNVLNQVGFGYLEARANTTAYPISTTDLATLGLTGVFTPEGTGYPEIAQSTFSGPALANGPMVTVPTTYTESSGPLAAPLQSLQPTWDFSDTFTFTKGRQTIYIGFGVRFWQNDLQTIGVPLGALTVNGQSTVGPSPSGFAGNQIADILLGNVEAYQVTSPGPQSNPLKGNNPHIHFHSWAPYFQDDVKVNPQLTVNAGLRYDYSSTPYEATNHFAWLNDTVPGGGLYVADPSIVPYGGGYYAYAGRRNPNSAPRNVFAPRVGFALRPSIASNTVIRAGYGLFYDTAETTEYQYDTEIYPYAPSQHLNAQVGTTQIDTNHLYPSLSNPVPITAEGLTFFQLQARKKLDPYTQNWSLQLEHELPKGIKLSADYEGSKGTHLLMRTSANQPLPCFEDPKCNPADPASPDYLPQTRVPFKNLGGTNLGTVIEDDWVGYSNYNAFNATAEKTGKDLTFLAAYTWSKAMDTKTAASAVQGDPAGWIGPQDSRNISGDYARSGYDVGQRVIVSALYSLPIGRGKKIVSDIPRPVDFLVGGWQVNGIGNFQGGFPFSISAPDYNNLNNSFAERAQLVGTISPSGFNKGIREWFNTAAFTTPPPGEFGNSGRNIIRGPRYDNLDLSLFKALNFEHVSLQFRLESFNSLNHPQFALPDAGVTDKQFGVISSTVNAARRNQVALKILF
ncbi:TonB-dependent receptor [Tunturibacter empetritectus]|uniref:TonB-dependent receptor n=1 Tax=Tunturiibacter empetritectus TaxID=3069691 RepID=UPI00161533C5|nr:TonB-dependent receptor [Edaphobacter lichenicola]